MPDDLIPTGDELQTGKPRVVWRDGLPHIAVDEDGVVSLHKLGMVPTALWRQGLLIALPDWAVRSNIDDPAGEFLALVVKLADQQRDTVAELREVRIKLKTALTLIGEAPGLAAVVTRLEAALKRVNALSIGARSAVSDATFMNAHEALRQTFRELEDDIERANADLAIAVVCNVSTIREHNIFEEDDQGKVVDIDGEAVRELLSDVKNAEIVIDTAVADHDWKIREALRRFKQALEREAASC